MAARSASVPLIFPSHRQHQIKTPVSSTPRHVSNPEPSAHRSARSSSKTLSNPRSSTIPSPPSPITPLPAITMPSSTNNSSKTYAPSIASSSSSTSTSTTASSAKPSKSPAKRPTRSAALLDGAKRLLADIGSSPTAAYDREQAARGEQTGSQEAFYMPNQMPRRT